MYSILFSKEPVNPLGLSHPISCKNGCITLQITIEMCLTVRYREYWFHLLRAVNAFCLSSSLVRLSLIVNVFETMRVVLMGGKRMERRSGRCTALATIAPTASTTTRYVINGAGRAWRLRRDNALGFSYLDRRAAGDAAQPTSVGHGGS